MKREVFIDGKLADVNEESAVGYFFNSPIFRDLDKINNNRTTTFLLPKTGHNLKIIGLSHLPDVVSDFPYKRHTFEERRGGLVFIKGECYLDSVDEKNISLNVYWGNVTRLSALKDLRLRDMVNNDYLNWDSSSSFLPSSSTDNFGFVAVDFGKGLDMEYVHPSVNFKYILDLITANTGITFRFPERFNSVMQQKWIPLIEKNSNEITWNDYKAQAGFDHFNSDYSNVRPMYIAAYNDPLGIIVRTVIKWSDKNADIRIKVRLTIKDNNPRLENGRPMDVSLRLSTMRFEQLSGGFELLRLYDTFASTRQSINTETGEYSLELEGTYSIGDRAETVEIIPVVSYIDSSGAYKQINSPEVIYMDTEVYIQKDVKFGDKYPIAPNLPDMYATDFLKVIMNMFGLFTYYDYRNEEQTEVLFTSVDDMYLSKGNHYNWTNKLISLDGNISYTYEKYENKNWIRYQYDEEIEENHDGYIELDNESPYLNEKDLFTFPFSPSLNYIEYDGNKYAIIPLYNQDGTVNKIKNRVLSEDKYILEDLYFKSAYFDKSLSLGGNGGILDTYYKAYQHVIRRPVVIRCFTRFSEVDMYLFKEITPVFIDGVYYIPIKVLGRTDEVVDCLLLKMPPLNISEL